MFSEKTTFFFRVFKIANTWGLLNIILFIPYEIFYGLKYNVKTLFSLNHDELDVEISTKAQSTEYFPTPYYIANRALKLVRKELFGSVFIDFGSGAGRMLMFASKFYPEKVIGVEFSKKLCDQANLNLKKFFESNKNFKTDWEVNHCDALKYKIPLNSNVFFLYDPFNSKIINRLVKNIKLSLKENKREILVIYISPVHRKVFIENDFTEVHSKINKFDKGYTILKF